MDYQQIPSQYNLQAAEETAEIQRGFITRVYAWMTFGLFVTAVAALVTISTPLIRYLVSTPFLFLGLFVGELILVLALTAAIGRLNPLTAGLLFAGYAGLNGVTLSFLLLVYTSQSIAITFGITAATFGIMTLWGFTTHRDLSKWGSLLIMGLIGLLLASLVNLFLKNPAIYWITTYAFIVVFIGLIAYDTQRLKNMSVQVSQDGELEQKASIVGALALYLDFINLFLLLLRILGKRR